MTATPTLRSRVASPLFTFATAVFVGRRRPFGSGRTASASASRWDDSPLPLAVERYVPRRHSRAYYAWQFVAEEWRIFSGAFQAGFGD